MGIIIIARRRVGMRIIIKNMFSALVVVRQRNWTRENPNERVSTTQSSLEPNYMTVDKVFPFLPLPIRRSFSRFEFREGNKFFLLLHRLSSPLSLSLVVVSTKTKKFNLRKLHRRKTDENDVDERSSKWKRKEIILPAFLLLWSSFY